MENEETGPAFVIKKKARPSKKQSIKQRKSEDEDDEETPRANVIVRDRKSSSRSSAASKKVSTTTTTTTTAKLTVKDPYKSSTPEADSKQKSMYSEAYLSELKAANAPKPPSSSLKAYDELTISKFGDSIIESEARESSIPTTVAIANAKARRAYLQKHGSDNSDFISLDVSTMPDKKGESRLVREEDEIDDMEDDIIIPLGKKAMKERERDRKREMQEMIDDVAEDDDEEELAWERGRMQAGVRDHRDQRSNGQKKVYRPSHIPNQTELPSLDFVQARLLNSLQNIEQSHEEQNNILEANRSERAELDKFEKELKVQLGTSDEKYTFFLEFRDWVEDVASFLEIKRPKLDLVINDNIKFQRERLEKVQERRFNDDADDMSLLTNTPVPSPWPTHTQEDDEHETSNGSGGVRSQERDSRRHLRRLRRQKTGPGTVTVFHNDPTEDDAYWTDDDLEQDDASDLAFALDQLNLSTANIFDDVKSIDYLDPSLGISPKFIEWKRKFPELYSNAFAGLAMVGVLEFWASKDMVPWNPFDTPRLPKSPSSLVEYSWHSILSAYTETTGSMDEEMMSVEKTKIEPEDDLVNAMVEKVVLGQLRSLASAGYDPVSSRATKRAIEMTDEISMCVDTSGIKFTNLFRAFMSRFQLNIALLQKLVLPYISTLGSAQSFSGPDGLAARNRLAHRGVKLLTNALKWRKFASNTLLSRFMKEDMSDILIDGMEDEESVELAGGGKSMERFLLEDVVEKYILPLVEAGWETGGRDIAVKVIVAYAPLNDTPYALPARVTERLQGRRQR